MGDTSSSRAAGPDSDREPTPLPDGLAEMAPGPELAAVLAGIPLAEISGADVVVVMQARYRQLCHERAQFLTTIVESGLRTSASTTQRTAEPGQFAPEEARTALTWSRQRAYSTYAFAFDVFDRLPVLGEAMLAGVLDEPRARAFIDWTSGLSDAHAARVVDQLLSDAPEMLVGELIAQIKYAATALDPDWARRRYAAALRERRIVGSANSDGTANVHGVNLPTDRAAAACDRIDTLARSIKRSGDQRRIAYIRTDLFLGMCDGTFTEMSDDEIVAYVLANPFQAPGDGSEDSGGPPPPEDGGGGPGDGSSGGSGDGSSSASGDGRSSASGDSGGPGDVVGDDSSGAPGHGVGSASGRGAGGRDARSKRVPSRRWSPREVRVALSTLLGLNERPGEIPGWSLVLAPTARQVVAEMGDAEWRYVICDDDGRPTSGGVLRARLRQADQRYRRRSRSGQRRHRSIVEVHVLATELDVLRDRAAESAEVWLDVVAELQARATIAAAVAAGLARHTDGDPTARYPTAWLRREVQLRDRCCTHPCCRMPAARTDIDHTVDYRLGGLTVGENLGCRCRHDHRLKHEGGWYVLQPSPGLTVWISPLGHRYENRPPPLIPRVAAYHSTGLGTEVDSHTAAAGARAPRESRECGCTRWRCTCDDPIMPRHRTASAGTRTGPASASGAENPAGGAENPAGTADVEASARGRPVPAWLRAWFPEPSTATADADDIPPF